MDAVLPIMWLVQGWSHVLQVGWDLGRRVVQLPNFHRRNPETQSQSQGRNANSLSQGDSAASSLIPGRSSELFLHTQLDPYPVLHTHARALGVLVVHRDRGLCTGSSDSALRLRASELLSGPPAV